MARRGLTGPGATAARELAARLFGPSPFLLLTPAPPGLLAMGPWKAPQQEQLLRDTFVLAPGEPPPPATPAVSKKTRRGRMVAGRSSRVQLDWSVLFEDGPDVAADVRPAVEGQRRVRKRSLAFHARLTRDEERERVRILVEQSKLVESPDRLPRLPSLRRAGDACSDVPRPCPFVSCRHNLYLDVSPVSGRIILNFPHLEPWEMKESCSMDVAERVDGKNGTLDLESVGRNMNLSLERIRQLEPLLMAKVKDALIDLGIDDSDG